MDKFEMGQIVYHKVMKGKFVIIKELEQGFSYNFSPKCYEVRGEDGKCYDFYQSELKTN